MFRSFREELTVDHAVEQPIPIFLGDVGNKPRVALAVESDFAGKTALNQEVGCWIRQFRFLC